MDQEAMRDFNEKLEEIVATLNYLNHTYHLHYVLNCLKVENNQYVINKSYFNPEINLTELEYFHRQITYIQKTLNYIPSLLSNGRMVVMCNDDEGKPEEFRGEWLKKGSVYIVIIMRRITKTGFLYELENMPNNGGGYSSSRFQRIIYENAFN